ncbi:hypothetical protein N9043_00915 [bacterium]|nr:hypothetical protein [bacterium]
MQCNRNNCENVMCDNYSSDYGYICRECLNELCDSALSYQFDIGGFMLSEKSVDCSDNKKEAIIGYYRNTFEWNSA